MKFFTIFFAAGLLLFAGFWIFDAPGSGMWIPTAIFAALLGGTLLYNFARNGSIFNENSRGK